MFQVAQTKKIKQEKEKWKKQTIKKTQTEIWDF